jgi:peptidoglycan/LPS O-acetylase OafA/YrhL
VHSSQAASTIQGLNGFQGFEIFEKVMGLGKYGVELFFFISGFLLSSIYGVDRSRLGKRYWFSRLARIWPLWALFFSLYLFIGLLFDAGPYSRSLQELNADGSEFLANPAVITFLSLTFTLFFSQALWNTMMPGGWSIQSEVAHYLVFPILMKSKARWFVAGLIVINMVTLAIVHYLSGKRAIDHPIDAVFETWVRLGFFSTFFYFLLGLAAHKLTGSLGFLKNEIVVYLRKYTLNAILGVAYVVTVLILPLPFGSHLQAVAFVAVVLLCSRIATKLGTLTRVLTTLGKYSYFIYFFHFAVLEIVVVMSEKVGLPEPLVGEAGQVTLFILIFSVVLLVSVPVGSLSWKIFESPILAYAKNRVK